MFINSVGTNWLTPDAVAVTGAGVQNYAVSGPLPGVMSLLIMSDVDIHVARGADQATTDKFLLLQSTYMEIPVGDIDAFSFIGTGAGNLYVIEWLG